MCRKKELVLLLRWKCHRKQILHKWHKRRAHCSCCSAAIGKSHQLLNLDSICKRVRCTVESSGNRAHQTTIIHAVKWAKAPFLDWIFFFKGFYCVDSVPQWMSLTSLSIGIVSQLFFVKHSNFVHCHTARMTVLVITSNYMFAAIQSFAGSTDFGHYASRLSSKGDLPFWVFHRKV